MDTKYLLRYREEQSVATRPHSGRPRALDAADLRTLERISEEAGGYVTWEGFAEKFNEETGKNRFAKTAHDCCKEAGWHTVRTLRTLPECKGCGEKTGMGT